MVCTYFDENFLNLVPAEHVEGLYGCLDYYQDVQDPSSIELLNRYEARYPGSETFTAGSACTGTYRALRMWESSVNEAGSLKQHDVTQRSITPAYHRVQEVPPRWCQVSTTCA